MPSPCTNIPTTSTGPEPNRPIARGARLPETAATTPIQPNTSPVEIGLRPLTCCRNNSPRNEAAVAVAKASRPPRLPAATVRRRSTLRETSGCAERASTSRNSASNATPAAKVPNTLGRPQPTCAAVLSA